MTCYSPPEVPDRELLAYIDGTADPGVGAHLERCAHCRERARRLSCFQDRLIAKLYRFDCPSPAELGEYHIGMLAAGQAAAVARHVENCPHCAREIVELEGFLADLSPTLELGLVEQATGHIRVLIARLINGGMGFDVLNHSAMTPALAGVRGQEREPRFYEADGIQVMVDVQADPGQPDGRAVLGLVIGLDDPHQLEVHLWHADRQLATVAVDELGNFHIPDLAPGSYDIILSGPEVEIHIEALEI